MKFFFALTILFCSFCGTVSQAATINGQKYVPISSWARTHSFHIVKQTRDEIVLSDKAVRLVFNIDSAESEINGVNVRLSYPVAKGGLISELDLEKTVWALAFPQKVYDGKIRTICLDPGHGGKDTGNRVHSFYWRNEKYYTLALADELRDQLKRAGYNVILTRSKDVYVDLPERPAIANRARADLFISLHFNATASGKDQVHGPETYCITPVGAASSNAAGEGADHPATIANRVENNSLLLAYEVQKSLAQNLHVPDRDVRRARFAVLRDARMPAILIEGGYMTHPVEGKKIFTAEYRKQMAAAIVKGILDYDRLTPSPRH
ncbi:MAG TPA: N-acetylmuramoyl-L-alanine amidase [Verrucomicrobiae bacterium]|nr:N-acetylmuramoyl-L-alanine amidase [Verrucomicrobiae bacterium]